MKPHPEMTVEIILSDLREQMLQDTLPQGVGYVSTHEEATDAKLAMMRALADVATKMRTLCVGCRADVPMVETVCCECGGFVCAACQAIEDDTCDHEPPEFPAPA